MRQREDGSPRRIKIQPQRLIDRHLKRGRLRAAAKDKDDGKTRGAEKKDKTGNARKRRSKLRPFNESEHLPGAEIQLRRQAEIFRRNGFKPREHEAHRKRHVEEHMGQQDSRQAIDGEQAAKGAAVAIDPDNPENGNNGGQGKRHGKDFEQRLAAEKLPPRQRKRHRQGDGNRQQR